MSEELRHFVNHMLWHLNEASFLYDLEAEDSEDRTRPCGPWSVLACSEALVRWLDLGMVHCEAVMQWGPDSAERPDGVEQYPADWIDRAEIINGYFVFDASASRQMMANPACWEYPGIGWFVQVNINPAHFETPDKEWVNALAGMSAALS
jgi:hypothetical protein